MEQATKKCLPMTELAQARISERLAAGDLAVDATIGNGADTFFLADAVGPSGHIVGFDIQSLAHERTHVVLGEAGLLARVTLIQTGHENLMEAIPEAWVGEIKAIMFNLGYLPRGDKAVITRSDTTLPALKAGAKCLGSGGRMTVVLYPGHEGGREETEAVKDWAKQLPVIQYEVEVTLPEAGMSDAPELLVVTKL